MMAILHAAETMKFYLIEGRFQIKTYHCSLKYFLEQWFSSLEQHKWVTKMLGYDYAIIHKKRKDNVVVDALSRKYEDRVSLFAISYLVPEGIDQVH